MSHDTGTPNLDAMRQAEQAVRAMKAERDALAEDEATAVRELGVLRDAAQEYFEATLPLLNDYPLTDDERRNAWQRLRESNHALRAALHREDGASPRDGSLTDWDDEPGGRDDFIESRREDGA